VTCLTIGWSGQLRWVRRSSPSSSATDARLLPRRWRRWRRPSTTRCPCLRPALTDTASPAPFPHRPSITRCTCTVLRAPRRLRYARTARLQQTPALARRPMACPAHCHVPSPWKQRPHRDQRWQRICNNAVISLDFIHSKRHLHTKQY